MGAIPPALQKKSDDATGLKDRFIIEVEGTREMKIGFIGLGIMGSRMAANLQKKGYSLVVFNRTRSKAEPLLGPCGTFSDSPAKLAEQVDMLFTMLAHPDAVEPSSARWKRISGSPQT